MRVTISWKHIKKTHKQYGNWNGDKYNTPFLDTEDIDDEEE